jgi:hypothetical protein
MPIVLLWAPNSVASLGIVGRDGQRRHRMLLLPCIPYGCQLCPLSGAKDAVLAAAHQQQRLIGAAGKDAGRYRGQSLAGFTGIVGPIGRMQADQPCGRLTSSSGWSGHWGEITSLGIYWLLNSGTAVQFQPPFSDQNNPFARTGKKGLILA